MKKLFYGKGIRTLIAGLVISASLICSASIASAQQLNRWGVLYVGESMHSDNWKYELILQEDGNLVLYGPDGPRWASGTWGKHPRYCTMQGDGNFVIYDVNNRPIWASNTAWTKMDVGHNLVLQDDGNLVIYHFDDVIWATGTNW